MEKREFGSDQTAIIYYAHDCNPRRIQVYFHWMDIWQRFPETGHGRLREPYYEFPVHGDGLFWDLLDPTTAEVLCYPVHKVRKRLEEHLGIAPSVRGET